MAEVWQEEVMWNRRGTDPSLDELFHDVTIQLLMRRDGVRESDVRALLGELKDARAAAGGATRDRGDSVLADAAPDQGRNIVGDGSDGPPDAKKFPIRFI